MNSRNWLCVVLLLACLWPSPARADLGGFRILRFDVQIDVQRDSDVIVEETIEVQFTERRHGIYREIPIRYTDPSGFQYGYDFQLLGVEDQNGRARGVKQTRSGPMVRLRIGDPNRMVDGVELYVVRYRASDVLRQFAEHDELYWNVTGHLWNTDIAAASVVVRLPEDIASDDLRVTGWAGRFGSKEENVESRVSAPGEVFVSTTGRLDRREGLTIAVAWPPGIVSFPGALARVWRFAMLNLIVIAPLLALFLLIRAYRKHGLDPSIPAAVMVRYEPPPGVSAGTIGTLVDERVDMADITATIVDLAVRGYLTIKTEVEEKFFGLSKTEFTSFERNLQADTSQLLRHERLVLEGLFETHPTLVTTEDLKEEFYAEIPGIRAALYDRLVEKKLARGNPQSIRRLTVGLGFLFGLLTFALGLVWASYQGAIFPNAAFLPVVCGIVVLVLFACFAPAMPRRTRAGAKAASWAKGFEEFAKRVDSDRMERDAARDMFEKLLPYAMALGVARKWSRKFEGIYADARPSWYVGVGHGTDNFSTVHFQESLQSAMSDAGQSMAATPRSSGSGGFSGGGFSGGGGGGGGGGSW